MTDPESLARLHRGYIEFKVKEFVERRQYLLNDTSLIEINSLI